MKWFMFALLLAILNAQETDEFVDYEDDDYEMLFIVKYITLNK